MRLDVEEGSLDYDWVVAFWDGECWEIPGGEHQWEDDEFAQIDERRVERQTAENYDSSAEDWKK